MNQVSPAEEIHEVVEIEIFALEEKPLPRARLWLPKTPSDLKTQRFRSFVRSWWLPR